VAEAHQAGAVPWATTTISATTAISVTKQTVDKINGAAATRR
jgi:hypothetical protein